MHVCYHWRLIRGVIKLTRKEKEKILNVGNDMAVFTSEHLILLNEDFGSDTQLRNKLWSPQKHVLILCGIAHRHSLDTKEREEGQSEF